MRSPAADPDVPGRGGAAGSGGAPAPRPHGAVRGWIERRPRIRRGYRAAVGTLGGIITGLGVIMLPLPGPGTLILIGGLAILATEFAWAQRASAWVRRQVARFAAWWRRRQERRRAEAARNR